MERVLFLVLLMFALYGLESVIPLVKYQRKSKKRVVSNVVIIAITLLFYLALSIGVSWIALRVSDRNFGILNWLGLKNNWAVITFGILLLDYFAAYLPHLFMHKISFMWRFHTVHHSDKAIDITTSLRQHPFETLWRVLFQAVTAALFGIPLHVLVLYQSLSAIWAQIEHANIKIPARLDKALQLVVVTPNMHKLHHSQWQKETDTNYGNIFSIWDRVFRTYAKRANYSDIKYGLEHFPKPDYSVKEMLLDIPANAMNQHLEHQVKVDES